MRIIDNGFTLIELILVMALIAILSVIGIGSYSQATVKARDTQRKNDLNQITKALESFNNDVGRYPKVDGFGEMTCPQINGAEGSCFGGIIAYFGDVLTAYMENIPTDPKNGRVYKYVPGANNGTYSYYAAMDNVDDRDVVVDSEGVKTDWEISCGDINCNYKITETGLVRTK